MVAHSRWPFYGRRRELGGLVRALLDGRWTFAAIRGRRRVGKTELVRRALEMVRESDSGGSGRSGEGGRGRVERPILYLQLVDESEAAMATRFRRAVAAEPRVARVGIDLADIQDHQSVAGAVRRICGAGGIVALDEFQACHQGPLRPLAASLQAAVDELQREDEGGALIVLGSVQTEMEALLHDRREPLYGRATHSLTLRPWRVATTLEVAAGHAGPERSTVADPFRFLTLWTLFDGVPKYWRQFAGLAQDLGGDTHDAWTMALAERLFLAPDAVLRDEGDVLLARELRRDNLRVLREIAASRFATLPHLRRALPYIDNIEQRLDALVHDLRLVEVRLPTLHRNRQAARYVVSDQFLRCWLGVFESAAARADVLPRDGLDSALLRDLRTLEGHAFETIVREASHQASRREADDFVMTRRVAGYWTRPESGGEIEIDYVAWNEDRGRVRFGSCKRSARAHDAASLAGFRRHVARYLETDHGRRFRDADIEYALFSPLFDAGGRRALERDGWICRDLADFARMLR